MELTSISQETISIIYQELIIKEEWKVIPYGTDLWLEESIKLAEKSSLVKLISSEQRLKETLFFKDYVLTIAKFLCKMHGTQIFLSKMPED